MSALRVAELTPEQIFGVMIYREQGQYLGRIATILGVPFDDLSNLVSEAEQGLGPRVASCGESGTATGSAYLRSAKDVAAAGEVGEVFMPRWQRNVLRMLVRHEGTLAVASVCAIKAAYPFDDVPSMDQLHVAMRRQGLRWEIEVREGRAFYVLGDKSLATLQAIIANRWRPLGAKP